MKYIIPAVLALMVGLVLWYIKKERLQLYYDIIESAQFPSDEGVGKYFVVKLRNAGNRAVSDVDLSIEFDLGKIKNYEFSDESLTSNVNVSDSELTAILPLFNPKENIQVTVTMIGKTGPILSPNVKARAVGVTGTPAGQDGLPNYLASMLAALLAGISVLVVFNIWNSHRQSQIEEKIEEVAEAPSKAQNTMQDLLRKMAETTKQQEEASKRREQESKKLEEERQKQDEKWKKDQEERSQGRPELRQVIFVVFNRSGIPDQMPQLLTWGEVEFWKTGLFLMHSFLMDQERSDSYVLALEQIMEQGSADISVSSVGFNLYMLGKMEQYRGNAPRAQRYFEECKEKAPLMYNFLMEADSSFDLEALKDSLSREEADARE